MCEAAEELYREDEVRIFGDVLKPAANLRGRECTIIEGGVDLDAIEESAVPCQFPERPAAFHGIKRAVERREVPSPHPDEYFPLFHFRDVTQFERSGQDRKSVE